MFFIFRGIKKEDTLGHKQHWTPLTFVQWPNKHRCSSKYFFVFHRRKTWGWTNNIQFSFLASSSALTFYHIFHILFLVTARSRASYADIVYNFVMSVLVRVRRTCFSPIYGKTFIPSSKENKWLIERRINRNKMLSDGFPSVVTHPFQRLEKIIEISDCGASPPTPSYA